VIRADPPYWHGGVAPPASSLQLHPTLFLFMALAYHATKAIPEAENNA